MLSKNITFEEGVIIDKNVFIKTMDGGKITIAKNTHIWNGAIIEAKGGEIIIGQNGYINSGTHIISTKKISIGRDSLIAEFVTIRDQDHAKDNLEIPYNLQGRVEGDVTIGDNVWIGAKSTVTFGVNIPDNTIVGANSVVTRSLTGARIFAGAPAHPISIK